MNEDDVRRIVREEIKAMGSELTGTELTGTVIGIGSSVATVLLPALFDTWFGLLGGFKPSGDDDAGDAGVTSV